MNRPPVAWILNLDAESELEARGAYTPSRPVRAIVERESRRLLGELVAPGDVVVSHDPAHGVSTPGGPRDSRAQGLPGLAWCPTPRALSRLEQAGALPAAAPTREVLSRVNARPFATAVRAPLAVESFVKRTAHSVEEALALLAHPAEHGWLVRRAFGAAGRGRRRIAPGDLRVADRGWLAASLRTGPVVIEPWVEVLREYTRSGWVHPDGRVVLSAPCLQETTREGAWTRTELPGRGEVKHDDDERLAEAAATAGSALARAGYFGPFGIDAFRHRDPRRPKRSVLNPLSEINARFTMDWTTAMGVRPELLLSDRAARPERTASLFRAPEVVPAT